MRKFLTTFITLLFSFHLYGTEVFVEPSLGFSLGSFEHQSNTFDSKGFGLTGRIGMKSMGLMAGLDLSFSSNSLDNPNDDSWESRQYGIFIGVDLGKNFPIKTWFSFYPYSELDHKSPIELFGSGFKFGLGYYPWIIQPISFTFEYMSSSFSEIEDSIGRRDLAIDSELSAIIFGVSFHFSGPF